MIKNVFWNSDEHRLRMLWRMVILIGLAILIAFVLINAIVAFGIIGFLIATGQLAPDGIPEFTEQLGFGVYPLADGILITGTMIGILLTGLLHARFIDRRRFSDYGFQFNRDWWLDLGFGLLLGAFLMLFIFLVELGAGWLTVTGFLQSHPTQPSFIVAIFAYVIFFLAVGIWEETVFRGYFIKNFAEGFKHLIGFATKRFGRELGDKSLDRWGIIIALILTSSVFGIAHMSNPNSTLSSTIGITAAGFFLSAGYILTGKLAIPIGLHITWNFFQGNAFGFPVSGTSFNQTTFIGIEQGGADLMTGGAFGPEAGLVGMAAMILGLGLTLVYVQRRYGKLGLHLPLAVPDLRPRKNKEEIAESEAS